MPAILKYKCPKCGARYEYGDDEAGTPVTCECGHGILFPAAPIPAPAQPSVPLHPPGPSLVERFTPAAVQFGATVAAALKSPPPPPPPSPEAMAMLAAETARRRRREMTGGETALSVIFIIAGILAILASMDTLANGGAFKSDNAVGEGANLLLGIKATLQVGAGLLCWIIAALVHAIRYLRVVAAEK